MVSTRGPGLRSGHAYQVYNVVNIAELDLITSRVSKFGRRLRRKWGQIYLFENQGKSKLGFLAGK